MKFLAMDTETGGLTAGKHSLLTAYMAVLDENFDLIDELNLKMKPDNGDVVAEEEALRINGIDLDEHLKVAIPYSRAQLITEEFLLKYSEQGKDKLVLIGQNLDFDKDFVQAYIINKPVWNKSIDKVSLDTMMLVVLLQVLKIVPTGLGRSLGAMAEFFGVRYSNAHDAKADIKITLRVVQKMIRAIRTGKIL